MNTAESLNEFWSRDEVKKAYFGPARLSHFSRVVARSIPYLDRFAFPKVLDVGCGPGKLAVNLPQVYYTGIDYAQSAIDWANKEKPYPTCSYLVGDIVKGLEFPDNYFDIVFCIQSLEHITEWQKAVKEMLRLTNSFVIITIPNGEMDNFPAHINRWSVNQARENLQEYGLINIEAFVSHIPDLFIVLDKSCMMLP